MKRVTMAIACWLAGAAAGAELPALQPEAAGMSADRLDRVTAVARRYVQAGELPGAMTVVARNGSIVHAATVGSRGTDDDRPLPTDAIYRMYSTTKVVTAVAVMQIYEQGGFQWSDPVAKFLPELSNLAVLVDGESSPARSPITMRQLVTHTSGLSYGLDPADPVDRLYLDAALWTTADLDAFAAKIGKLPLRTHPGTEWRYSVGMDLAGLVVQRLSGQRLDRYLSDNVFRPLDMRDTAFSVPAEKRERLLPNHILGVHVGGSTRPVDQDNLDVGTLPGGLFEHGCGSGCDYANVTLFSGGAGLVSTARDFMRFGEMLRNGGRLGDVRILSPTSVDLMASAHVPPEVMAAGGPPGAVAGLSFGLGVLVLTDPVARGVSGTAGEFFHDGAGGTIFWVDRTEGIIGLGLTQVLGAYTWGAELKTAVYQAVIDSNR